MKVTKNKDRDEGAAVAAYSIPEAGAMVGLSRNGSYDAARRNEIPVLQFGRRKIGIADPRRLRTDSDLLEKAAQTFLGILARRQLPQFCHRIFQQSADDCVATNGGHWRRIAKQNQRPVELVVDRRPRLSCFAPSPGYEFGLNQSVRNNGGAERYVGVSE